MSKYTIQDKETALKLFQEGMTATQIARLEGMPSTGTVNRWLVELGVKTKVNREPSRSKVRGALARYRAGASLTDLAFDLKTNLTRMKSILRREERLERETSMREKQLEKELAKEKDRTAQLEMTVENLRSEGFKSQQELAAALKEIERLKDRL